MGVVILQIGLGGISLVFRTPPAAASPSAEQLQQADVLRPAVHALLTTSHQTVAALLLAIATILTFWTWRFLVIQARLAPEVRR